MLFQRAALLGLAGLASAKGRCKPGQQTASASASAAASASSSSSPSAATSASSSAAAVQWETKYTATGAADVAAAAATAKTSSPTSKVKGKAFDRVAFIYFENTDYDKAIGDPNFADFAKKGITLDNYYAVTHPSEPNYMAAIVGDYFGMQNDAFNRADANVSSVIDLLEHKGISWGLYQEDQPYTGYEGMDYKNQLNGANDYVRKHNPAVLLDSITRSEDRLSQVKNLSMIDTERSVFHQDLKANKLPQWMFITPNMTSDGHDTTVTVAGNWCRDFLGPLMDDKNFMDNTLVVVTFDENETYSIRNRILAILVGDAVPSSLHGTTDHSFYNHYSEIATVEANWDLPTLGRFDVGANVYDLVAKKTGDKVREYKQADLDRAFWNASYAGYFNSKSKGNTRYPAPNLKLDDAKSGRKVFGPIRKTWEGSDAPTYYEDKVELADGLNPPKDYSP